MVKTYRHKKTRSKKTRSKKMYRRRRKGGAPTPAQLAWAAKGLKRKSRPSSLKIGNTPSPTDRMTYVYNPETPSHVKILAEQRKQQIINKPLAEKNQFYILEIFQLPEHLPKDMDRGIQYFYIDGDEAREIFTFGPDDIKLQATGFAYINGKFKELL